MPVRTGRLAVHVGRSPPTPRRSRGGWPRPVDLGRRASWHGTRCWRGRAPQRDGRLALQLTELGGWEPHRLRLDRPGLRPKLPRSLPRYIERDDDISRVLTAAATPDPSGRMTWAERDLALAAVLAGTGTPRWPGPSGPSRRTRSAAPR